MVSPAHPTSRSLLLTIAGCLALLACNEKPHRADENLAALEVADRKLLAQESQLLNRRGALQRERTRIRDKRTALLSRKLALPEEDSAARKQLEQEESKLASLEAGLVQQELKLNKRLQTLLTRKTDMVEQLTKEKGSAAREMLVGRREHSLALRERELGRRENELARREATLARREQAFAVRQAKICPQASSTVQVVQVPQPSSGGASYRRKDVEPVFRAALKAMAAKGIRTADLPPGIDRLITQIRHDVAKRKYTRAKYAADQLLATVRKMRIDRSFIGGKIGRLSAAIKRSPPRGARKTKVNKLFQEATAAYGDGRFISANRKLNSIYSLLR